MSYPLYWDRTVTVYNKAVEDNSVIYHRTVLKRCFFCCKTVSLSDDGNLSVVKEYTVRIRKSDLYLPPVVYNGEHTDRSKFFTLKPGDIILYGEVSAEISDIKGKRPGDILKAYDGFEVTEAVCNDIGRTAHYKAVGKSG